MNLFAGILRKSPPPSFDLANIQTASPCQTDWSKMIGDDRVRHCAECNLNVYNLSAMKEREIQQLLAVQGGKRLCARFYRRADGTIMTQDCPWNLRVVARKVSRLGTAVLTAVLSVGFVSAKSKTKQASCDCQQIQQKGSGVKLTVVDPQGFVIPGANILLESKSKHEKLEGVTGPSGEWGESKLAHGQYSIFVKSNGFRSFTGNFEVRDGMLLEVRVKLPVATVSTTVIVESQSTVEVGAMGTITTAPQQMPGFGSAGRPAPMRR
jgi:hypothetical protein